MNRNIIIKSLWWKFIEIMGSQGVNFLIQLVLARLLAPDDYGLIAIVAACIAITDIFVQKGLSNSLIQKKYTDALDYSSMFYSGMAIAILIYFILFFMAPYIADFYNNALLINVLRIYGIKMIIGTLCSVQDAILRKEMKFKTICLRNISSVCISGIVGLCMAYTGYGIWALVGQQLTYSIVNCIVLWSAVKWKPQLQFSIYRAKLLLNFGWKWLLAALLQNGCTYIIQLSMGKMFSEKNLGYYTRGEQFPSYVVANSTTAIGSVIFPAFSKLQEDTAQLKEAVRRAIKTCTFVIFPLMLGLALVSEPLISLLLTDKWLPCIPFLKGFCVFYALSPIQMCLMQAILALGYSDKYLKVEICKQVLYFLVICCAINLHILAVAYAIAFCAIVFFIINGLFANYILKYSLQQLCKDIMPNIISTFLMGIIVWAWSKSNLNNMMLLVFQILSGGIMYIITNVLIKNDSILYIWNFFYLKRRNKAK